MAYEGVQGRTTEPSYRPPPPPSIVNPSAFGTVDAASSACETAARRVENIVRRLCGDVPEDGAQAIKADPNGLLDAVTKQALDIQLSMQRINDAVTRLESQLP